MAQQAWWKKNPPRAAKPRMGKFLFTMTAKPWMGENCDLHRNWDVPFVTHREFSRPKIAKWLHWYIPNMKGKTYYCRQVKENSRSQKDWSFINSILPKIIFSVKIEWHLFWRNWSIPPNFFWRNWIYGIPIPPSTFFEELNLLYPIPPRSFLEFGRIEIMRIHKYIFCTIFVTSLATFWLNLT